MISANTSTPAPTHSSFSPEADDFQRFIRPRIATDIFRLMAGPDSREIIFTMGEQITTNSISKDIQLFRDLLGSHPRLQPYSCATYVDDVPMHVWEGIGLNSDDLDTVRSWLREARIREVRDIFESAQEQGFILNEGSMRDPNDTHFYRSSPKGNFSELLQKIQTISETFSAQTTEDRNTFDHASSFAHVGDLSPAYWEAAGFSDEEKYEIQDLLITGYSREARTLYEKAEKQGSISNNHYQRLGADEFSQLCWCVQKISGHDLHDRGVYNFVTDVSADHWEAAGFSPDEIHNLEAYLTNGYKNIARIMYDQMISPASPYIRDEENGILLASLDRATGLSDRRYPTSYADYTTQIRRSGGGSSDLGRVYDSDTWQSAGFTDDERHAYLKLAGIWNN